MNEQQAVEMLNLMREMNAKLDKIDSLETRFDRLEAKVDAGFRRLDDKVEALSDTLANGLFREQATLDERVKKIERLFNGWTPQ